MKFGCFISIFLNSAKFLLCRRTDISKCVRGSLRLRDNESRLYNKTDFLPTLVWWVRRKTSKSRSGRFDPLLIIFLYRKTLPFFTKFSRGSRVMRWCWVNLQCRGVLLIWIRVGQGPTVLAVGAGGGCLDIFSLVYHFSFLSPSLCETARYRLKYCLKGPLSPQQPTNQSSNIHNYIPEVSVQSCVKNCLVFYY